MKTRLIVTDKTETRASSWKLVQCDDGTLHVEQEAEYWDGDRKKRLVPLSDFIQEKGPAPRALQGLIDRMFAEP
jgi:hypothetical protein